AAAGLLGGLVLGPLILMLLLLVIAMLMTLVTKGPRAMLGELRGMFPRERP
ncbi:hypothetical protein HMI51_33530, partial [Corallococcus coralloides]|nr:hypothetical protein [Corallococcus coralloides]